ncbi:MAG: 16S rRNA (uracil(1498)-N(3))-methyltransferase [Caulobacterales bacterium]
MPDPRLYIEDALHEGAQLSLDDGQSRKLTSVLRLGPGSGVRVFNEEGEWRAIIAAASKKGVTVEIGAQSRQARRAPDLDLLFAPVKRDATDLVVEKATELGVRRIRPVITARTIADTVRLDRLSLIARSAAEQTERFDIPEIAPPLPLIKALDGWEEARALIYADEAGEVWGGEKARDIARALAALNADAPLAVLIGPEGGFTPEERTLLRSKRCVIPVSLGPRILRAETAAIATLAVVQALVGDWRRGA